MNWHRTSATGEWVVCESPVKNQEYPDVLLAALPRRPWSQLSFVKIGEGISPVFITPGVFAFANGGTVRTCDTQAGFKVDTITTLAKPIHKLESAGTGGHWVAHHADHTYTDSRGRTATTDGNWPAISAVGTVYVCNPGEQLPRFTDAGFVVCVREPDKAPVAAPASVWGMNREAHMAVPLLVPGYGYSLLRLENERLVLQVGNTQMGWQWPGRIYPHPEAVWIRGTNLIALFADGWSTTLDVSAVPAASLEPVVVVPPTPKPPTPEPPKPPVPTPPPTRTVSYDEWRNMEGRLEDTYHYHGKHPARSLVTHVDEGGEQWRKLYFEMARTQDHESVMRHIEGTIDVIEGRPNRWLAPVEPPPVRVLPKVVGYTWPMPGEELVHPSPTWLQQFKEAGIGHIRMDVPTTRDRDNAEASVRTVQAAGITVLPLLTWPYRHPDAQALIDYVDWFLDRFPNPAAIELGNEPWVLKENDKVTGEEFLHCAKPMALRILERSPQTKVYLAFDRWNHITGKLRGWPGGDAVRDFTASDERLYAALHPYRNPHPPSFSGWGTRKAEHEAIVKDLGHSRYIVTETGWKPAEGADQGSGAYHTDELYVHGELGVPAVYLYTHISDPHNPKFDFGLWEVNEKENTITPRPSALAVAKVLAKPTLPAWYPTKEEAAKLRAAIALDQQFFSPFCLSFPEPLWQGFINRTKAADLTHVYVMLSGEYRGRFSWFSLWDNIPFVRKRLRELLDAHIIPILWAANGESFRASQLRADAMDVERRALARPSYDYVDRDGVLVPVLQGVPLNAYLTSIAGFNAPRVAALTEYLPDTLEEIWQRVLPQLADLLPIAVPAPEMNDIWTPQQQHDRTVLLRSLLPQSLIWVHFTRGRAHGDHNRGTGPDGQPPTAWKPTADENNPGKLKAGVVGYWGATPADGLFYNMPYDHLESVVLFRDDLGDVAVRVDGRMPVPGKSAPYPGQRRAVYYGEGPAEWVLAGSWRYDDGQALRDWVNQQSWLSGTGD